MREYQYIAHRGVFSNEMGVPENSLAAFRRAVEAGLAIELDVRLSKDGKLVVFHDTGCKRMTGVDVKVSALPYSELRKLRLRDTEEHIPLLSEVLKLVKGRVPLLIEVKNIALVGRLEWKLLKLLRDYQGKYIIESFHPGVVGWMKRHAKGVSVGQLVSMHSTSLNPVEKLMMKMQGFYWLTRADFMSYDIRELTPAMAREFHKRGMKVYGWTVRSVSDYIRMKNICDGVIFDTVSIGEILVKKTG